MQHEDALPMELYSVYVPTNHIYVGDIFLLGKEDIIHTNLSVRFAGCNQICWCWLYRLHIECYATAAEIVVSVGMALPRNLSAYIKT